MAPEVWLLLRLLPRVSPYFPELLQRWLPCLDGMLTLDSLVALLQDMLADHQPQLEKIHKFQDLVWNELRSIEGASAQQEGIIGDLAYDLDFFEPDERVRAESTSYFGEERARNEIADALRRIEQEREA